MQWPWQRPRLALSLSRAVCPLCRSGVGVMIFEATHTGGDGQKVVSDPAGVVKKCCSCGHQYTVLNDGSVLPRFQPPREQKAESPPPKTRYAIDEDMESLDG